MRSVLQAFTPDLIMASRSVRRSVGLPEDFTFDERLAGTWECGDEVWTFARQTDKDLGDKPF
jgi:hypothetical protein